MRYLIVLIFLSFPAYAQECTDPDLKGTWRIYTTPLDMDGVVCTTSCQFRIGKGNRVMTPPSDCEVRNTFLDGLEEVTFPIERGFLHYSSRMTLDGTDNNRRYAVVSGRWIFNTPNGEMRWDFDGEQEHSWKKRKGLKPSKGAVKCKTKTIHGRVLVYKDNILMGQASAKMVWRSPASHLKD